MANSIEIRVPDLGDFSDVEVIEVLVEPGDQVSREDGLITLETDKAAMDVPAADAGEIEEISVSVGDTVSTGDVIGRMKTAEAATEETAGDTAEDRKEADGDRGSAAEARQEAPPEKKEPAVEETQDKAAAPKADRSKVARQAAPQAQGKRPAIDEAGFSKAHASPSVRKLARELGVDLASVKGSGEKNRVLHDDVKAFVKEIMTSGGAGAALPRVPAVDFAKFGEIETKPLTRIQKFAAPRLQASWVNLPHVTQHDLADITELEAKRQELKEAAKARGIGLTVLAFIMRAGVAALREYPRANASLAEDGANLVYKKYIHLGFAADTEHGLVVPVIRDADKKDVYEIATELGELSKAAREGKLKAEQMQGASFTVSSLGGIGGTAFTPIVNAPEVAILGVSRSSMQPMWDGAEFRPRLMLPLSLSYDHRVIDGAYAVRLTTFLSERLADVDALLAAIP